MFKHVWIKIALSLLTIASLSPLAHAERFLVIAPESYQEALAPFLEHKQKQLDAAFVSLEDVIDHAEGVDDAERLKRFLWESNRKSSLQYVLLVGDCDVMPIRYMVLDRVTQPAFDYAFYPSDLYYADLSKQDGSFESWNGENQGFHAGYFGEVRGEANKKDPINFDQIDYRPEIAVGRWPVSTATEVAALVKKSIAHEEKLLEGKKAGLGKAALFSVDGWVDSRPTMNQVAGSLGSDWEVQKNYYGTEDSNLLPTEKSLENILQQGVGLVLHAGHGQDHCWEGCFPIEMLDRLKNADRLPIVISAGCSTARFSTLPPYEKYQDVHGVMHQGTNLGQVFKEPPPPPACYQTGLENPTGLGEQLLRRNENGAIAYIGCTTGSQPCGLSLLTGFAKSYRKLKAESKSVIRLGDCWSGAMHHYYEEQRLEELVPNDDWYPPSIFFQGMKFICFGDPTLPVEPTQAK